MTIIPVAAYAPDLPSLPGQASATISNVLPRTPLSYGPFPSLTTLSTALTARCQGATAFQDKSGNNAVFAGDATHLYRLPPGTMTFADVSIVTNYTTSSTERWSFAVFGERVIATNFTNNIQTYLSGSSTLCADLSSGAPKARCVGIIKDFVFAGNTNDGVDGAVPNRVWWCAIGDPTNWPAVGGSPALAAQSDQQDIFEMGEVQAIVGGLGAADGAVLMERGIVRVNYVGSPNIFNFFPAQGARGCSAPGSVALAGAAVFYLGEDGLYVFDGANSNPVGLNKIDKTFFADLDQSSFHLITSAIDPINKIYLMAYPGAGHQANSCNRILAYNWGIDRFSITEAAAIEVEQLLRTFSLGYSLDSLDNVSTNIDTGFTDSFDSRVWTGGRLLLSAFNLSHKLCYFTGANLAPTVDTPAAELFEGKRGRINRVRPIVDATSGTPSVAIGTKDLPTSSPTFGTAVTMDSIGSCAQRADGRYHTGRITLPAGSTYTHISGIEISEAVPLGNR